MDTVEYTIRSCGDTVTVDALHPVPGLYVYETPKDRQNPDHNYHWLIGHQSGFSIGAFEHQADAMTAAQGLAGFTHWDRTSDELLADPDLDPREVRDFIEDMGGAFLSRQPVDA